MQTKIAEVEKQFSDFQNSKKKATADEEMNKEEATTDLKDLLNSLQEDSTHCQ